MYTLFYSRKINDCSSFAKNSTAENNSGDTSDEEVHSDVPSDASTPSPIRTPFRPQFQVVVSYAVKDGDSVRFTIDVSKVNCVKIFIVIRVEMCVSTLHSM